MRSISRNSKGKFQKGTSGNPSGRPPGSRNKATLLCEQLLDNEGQELFVKAIQMAKKGNIHALRLCLERILPVRKERCIDLELRPFTSGLDLSLQFQDISTAVAEGRITPGEGESLAHVLSSHARILETAEFDRRLADLEAMGQKVQSYRSELKRFVQQAGLEEYHRIQAEERQQPDEPLAEEECER
jgi:Family of unknown function (DUF5681)